MYYEKFNSKKIVSAVITSLLILTGTASAEKSVWQKIVDFFSPGESIDCDGPVCEELRALESRISKVEGKYSRERRPMNKERFKKELDSLNVIRDSLIIVVKGTPEAKDLPVSSSSESALSSSMELVASSVSTICGHDTVFIHDTVVVHDTLYVMLANKPVEPVNLADSSAKSADSTTAENSTVAADSTK